MKLREDGVPITTEEELKELLGRIRDEALTAESSKDFILWIREILVDHPLLD